MTCPACQAEMSRWLDTTPATLAPRFGFAHGSGAEYDVSPAGLRDNGRARYDQWRDTVRRQRALVAEGCQAGRHAEPVDTSQS